MKRTQKNPKEKPVKMRKLRNAFLKAKKFMLTEIPPLRFGGPLHTISFGDSKKPLYSKDKNGPHFNFRPKVVIAAMVFIAITEVWRSQGLPPIQRAILPWQASKISENIQGCYAEDGVSYPGPGGSSKYLYTYDAAAGQAKEMLFGILGSEENGYARVLLCAESAYQKSGE